jgi:hypothetical protein
MIAWLVLLQTSLTIAVAGPATSAEYLPLHVAQAEGFFTAQQLSVTLRSTRSDATAAEMLASGQAQLAATSLDTALRLGGTDGVPPRLIWALTAAPPVALLVAPGRADTIRAVADLVGQTVAIPAPGTAEDQALGLLLARAGVPVHRVKMLSLGERGVVRALEGGEVAAGDRGGPAHHQGRGGGARRPDGGRGALRERRCRAAGRHGPGAAGRAPGGGGPDDLGRAGRAPRDAAGLGGRLAGRLRPTPARRPRALPGRRADPGGDARAQPRAHPGPRAAARQGEAAPEAGAPPRGARVARAGRAWC